MESGNAAVLAHAPSTEPAQASLSEALALSRSNAHFATPKGRHLFERLQPYHDWIGARHRHGFFPYARRLASPPGPIANIAYLGGDPSTGVNLAVQDYLALASHPLCSEAAISAVQDFGLHSAGSPMLLGNNSYSERLEAALAEHLQMEHVLLFPTGWAAGFGVIKGLVREHDHVVMDALAHACLQEGAAAATPNISRFRHLDVNDAAERLKAIRDRDARCGILVVAEGLYSMDSDTPDLASLLAACRTYSAQLLVDVAHDLGSIGPLGTGVLGLTGLLGEVDLVVGAFSKTFASNGGFVATRDVRAKSYLRWFANPHTFSNALSPIQCAVVAQALDIVRSPEGDARRAQLNAASLHFRQELEVRGCKVLGEASAIVPVLIGAESTARCASRRVAAEGVFTNLVEFPAVGLRQARFRCQLMSSHGRDELNLAAQVIADAISDEGRDGMSTSTTVPEG